MALKKMLKIEPEKDLTLSQNQIINVIIDVLFAKFVYYILFFIFRMNIPQYMIHQSLQ